MNPRIHHPYWYRQIDVITDQEVEEAVKRDDMVCLPPVAHFGFSGFEISCQLGRWEIRTDDRSRTARLLSIAAEVFKLLDHTPVSAAGINVNAVRQVSVPSVASILGAAAGSLRLGLEGEGSASAEVSMSWSVKGCRLTIWVVPVADAPSFVEIRNNAQYHEFGELLGTHFDLGAVLERHFADDVKAALEQVDRVVESLQQRRDHVV